MRAWQHRAAALGLHRSPQWLALLHVDEGVPRVEDSGFLLSGSHYSPERELAATLNWLYSGPSDQVCRFPARYEWLQAQLHTPALALSSCELLQEFLQRAPASEISLVFASENVAQPSSMMGHLFLKLVGPSESDVLLAHAVSFFTDADTINLPKLFYESLVTGKPGFFALSPYADQVSQYIDREHRSLWEYALDLNETERRRLQMHLHELRQTRFRYFFQGYNCATLVKHVLGVVRPEILSRHDPWTTPKDVVRHAEAVGLVREARTITPSRWRVRALTSALSQDVVGVVHDAVAQRRVVPSDLLRDRDAFLALVLEQAYLDELKALGELDAVAWTELSRRVSRSQAQRFPGIEIQAGGLNDPRESPPDNQWSIGLDWRASQRAVRLDLLPMSHRLDDPAPQGNVETGLALLDASIVQPLDGRGGPRLRRLTIYAIDSLLPHDPLIGGLSGRFRIGWDDDDPAVTRRRLHGWIGGSLGKTWRAHRDVDAYGLIGFGLLGAGDGLDWQVRATQEAGLLVREAFNMKSVVSVSQQQHAREVAPRSTVWRWSQAKALTPNWTLVADWRRTVTSLGRRDEGSLMLQHLY